MRKLCVIGAGSSYVPEVLSGLLDYRDRLNVDTLYLMDIDSEKLSVMHAFCERMFRAAAYPVKILSGTDQREAIEGADYVLAQIRVGQMAARIRDEKIPLKYNLIGQETTGIGGFLCALRTLGPVMRIARDMEELAPDAFLINFSNPSGLLAEAILNYSSVKAAGLCNIPINMEDGIRKLCGNARDIQYDFVGLNHLNWITRIEADGEDVPLEKSMELVRLAAMKNVPKADFDEVLLGASEGIPCSYLNYYLFRREQLEKEKTASETRGEHCLAVEKDLLKLYENTRLCEKPALLSERGGARYSEAAIRLIHSLENNVGDRQVLNVRNEGRLAFMRDSDVVELACRVDRKGIVPQSVRKPGGDYIRGMMQAVKAYERLTVQAFMEESYEKCIAALLVHPLIGDYPAAKACFGEMCRANREYLPAFLGRAQI